MPSEDNKAIVRRIEEAWNTNDLDSLDPIFAPDFLTHSGVLGMSPTLATAKVAHGLSMKAFPDRKTVIEDMVAEGDNVAVRVRMTGTNSGGLDWFGIPANNRAVDVQWIGIYRLNDGKVVEHRAIMDLMGLMQQLGAMPAQG